MSETDSLREVMADSSNGYTVHFEVIMVAEEEEEEDEEGMIVSVSREGVTTNIRLGDREWELEVRSLVVWCAVGKGFGGREYRASVAGSLGSRTWIVSMCWEVEVGPVHITSHHDLYFNGRDLIRYIHIFIQKLNIIILSSLIDLGKQKCTNCWLLGPN